jgi:hypothetical protein
MLHVEKLNMILSIMYEQEGFRVMTPEMVKTMLTRDAFKKHAGKLVRDRYAIYVDKDSMLLSLTPKGSEFIRKGGYAQGEEQLFFQGGRKRNLIMTSLSLLLLTALVLIIRYYLSV